MNIKNKRIGFRVDGSQELGLGHIFRCMALADNLEGCEMFFWVKENPSVEAILKQNNVTYLSQNINVQQEIDLLAAEVKKKQIDAIIADLLVYPDGYLEQLKQTSVKIITFHEFKKSFNCSDIAINYNTFSGFDDYENIASMSTCFGPSYIIIRDGIRSVKPVELSKEVKTILISMGGSDPGGITLKVAKALEDLSSKVKIIIHAGPAFKFQTALSNVFGKGSDAITVKANVPELGTLMIDADVAVASGGNTMYELCYLGIPSIIISQNMHQYEFAEELNKKGAVKSLGLSKDIGKNAIKKIVEKVCNSYEERTMIAENAKKIIDGKGVDRIKARIYQLIYK